MRMSFRLIISLIVGVTLLSFLFALFQVKAAKRGLRRDLEKRAAIEAESLEGRVEPLLEKRSRRHLQPFVTEIGNRQKLIGLAVFDAASNRLAITSGLANYIDTD